jgi:scyllo-inositol 2-dehydrogenase (NADP+)
MKETKIKTGILSFGMSGSLFHAPFLETHDNFELCAVVERSKKKAQEVYPNIISFDAVDALLENPDIELVVINTPNNTHFEFALKAIRNNKHVLVEKPFCVTASEAAQLFAEAKKYDKCVMPYQNRRYDSDFLSVKKVIESGKLGRLIEVRFRYDRYVYNLGANKIKEAANSGNGIMYNLASHVLDSAIALFGKPIEWNKSVGFFRPNTEVDDYGYIHLIFPNNLQVFLTVSLLVAAPQAAFVINGTKGTYVKYRTDIQEAQLQQGMHPDDASFGLEDASKMGVLTTISEDRLVHHENIASSKASYKHVFDDVYNTIRKGKPYPVSEVQIIQQLEILEA